MQADQEIDELSRQIEALKVKLTEARRRRPQEPVADQTLLGADGVPVSLAALFGDKDDLIVVHNMGRGCAYCTMWTRGDRAPSVAAASPLPRGGSGRTAGNPVCRRRVGRWRGGGCNAAPFPSAPLQTGRDTFASSGFPVVGGGIRSARRATGMDVGMAVLADDERLPLAGRHNFHPSWSLGPSRFGEVL